MHAGLCLASNQAYSLFRNHSKLGPKMSLAKIPFLLTGTVAGYVCTTPPNPSVPPEQRPRDITTYERFFSSVVRVYSFSFKV